MKLIAGLGNPGPAYRNTRHNAGFLVMDRLAQELRTEFTREKYKGLVAQAAWNGESILLLKPMTFMNRSGESIAMAARYKINDPNELLVVYDDVELPLGKLRIRRSGSPGTHNGMKSALERLGTREIPRLRLGVGEKVPGGPLTDHVLGKFKPDEREAVDEMVARAAEAALRWIEAGITTTMNEFN